MYQMICNCVSVAENILELSGWIYLGIIYRRIPALHNLSALFSLCEPGTIQRLRSDPKEMP